ncbi:MAG: hypothetical protein ACREMY_34315, partial [bacterium]
RSTSRPSGIFPKTCFFIFPVVAPEVALEVAAVSVREVHALRPNAAKPATTLRLSMFIGVFVLMTGCRDNRTSSAAIICRGRGEGQLNLH